jgi:hypothetical protein
MTTTTLQQINDKRSSSFLKEQINHVEKDQEMNNTVQVQIIDDNGSIQDACSIDKVEPITLEKRVSLDNPEDRDIHKEDRLFLELDSLEWRRWQIAFYS